jgi:ribonuclease Y
VNGTSGIISSALYAGMLILGIVIGLFIESYIARNRVESARELARKMEQEARASIEAENAKNKLRLQEELEEHRVTLENRFVGRQGELQKTERRLIQKESFLDHRSEQVELKDRELDDAEERVRQKGEALDVQRAAVETELHRIAELSRDEARTVVLDEAEKEARTRVGKMVGEIVHDAQLQADAKAAEIIATSIQRIASGYVGESTISVVPLPSEDWKGRIIGREGRNIRAFETLTGVDLLIDDTPEAVTLSAFNPIRREVARIALERLVADGRIHPAHIEQFVEEAEKQMDERVFNEGQQAANHVGISGLSDDLMRLMGRLKYRTSYGQNILAHSIEAAFIAANIASELKLPAGPAKRAAFLHDIGKAVDYEIEGSHAIIGSDILTKAGEPEQIAHAVAAHHSDTPMESVLDVIVQVADALSASRPGARRESVESYIKRLEKLEAIANSVPGIKKAFAIQAGRELRILVEPDEVNESLAAKIALDVARKVELEVSYPGQVKVTVVRETRYSEYAK